MEQSKTYEEALSMLQQGELASGAYFIISGVNGHQGAIINRNYPENENDHPSIVVEHLGDSKPKKQWFLVQSNKDREDYPRDIKVKKVEKRLVEFGNNINYDQAFDLICSQSPSFEKTTIYSTIQSASDSYFKTIIYYRDNNNNNKKNNN